MSPPAISDAPGNVRPIDQIEITLGVVITFTAAVSFAGIALSEAGHFSGTTLVGAAAGILAGLVMALRAALRAARTRVVPAPLLAWASLAAVILAGALLFRPPADASIDGSDGSMYLAIGRMIASTGSLHPVDKTLDLLPADVKAGLFSRDHFPPLLLDYFSGGIQIAADGRTEPSFFHLEPIWMAVFAVAFGGSAPLEVNPVFGALAVALMWAAGRRLCRSTWGGLAAAALLLSSFGEIWFARFPTTEILTQALTVTTLLALLALADTGASVAAVLAGVAVGLLAFCRLDSMLLVTAPLLALAVWLRFIQPERRRAWSIFIGVGGSVAAYAAVHAWLFAGAYTERILYLVSTWRGAKDIRIPISGAAACVLIVLAWRWIGHRRTARIIATSVLAAAGVWLAATNGRAWIDSPFLLLVPPAAAGIALAGLVSLLLPPSRWRAAPLIVVFLISAVTFLQNSRDLTLVPMQLRRFVPTLLPVACLFVIQALSLMTRTGVGKLAAASAAVAQIAVAGRHSAVLVRTPAYQEVSHQMQRLADAVPFGGVTIFDRHTPSHMATTLHYQFARDALAVSAEHPHAAIRRAAEAAMSQGRRVFVAVPPQTGRPDSLLRSDFEPLILTGVGEFDVRYESFDTPDQSRLPPAPHGVTETVDLYEVIDPWSGVVPLPLRIDAGTLDFGSILSGFQGIEVMNGATVRWTDGLGRVIVPPLAIPDGSSLTLRCRLAAPIPAGVALPTVQVGLDGALVGSIAIASGDFREYTMTLPSTAAPALRRGGVLDFQSSSFVPADRGGSNDRRHLGLVIDWIEIQ